MQTLQNCHVSCMIHKSQIYRKETGRIYTASFSYVKAFQHVIIIFPFCTVQCNMGGIYDILTMVRIVFIQHLKNHVRAHTHTYNPLINGILILCFHNLVFFFFLLICCFSCLINTQKGDQSVPCKYQINTDRALYLDELNVIL